MASKQQPRRSVQSFVGRVTKQAGANTVVVTVKRQVRHSRYLKVVLQVTKLKVHDAASQCHVGDQVHVEACRPISRTKRWRVIRIVRPAAEAGAAAVVT